MLRARRLVRRLKPDIVHAHYATSGGLAGLVCGVRPTVVTVHGTDLTAGMKSPVWRTLLKAVFQQAACVNTVSSDLTRMALSLGAAPGKIVELTLGVDTRRFHAGGRRAFPERDAVRLVCTRRLEPVYDHRTIVEALAIVRAKGVEFRMTFAGDGPLRGELESLVERRGLGDATSFIGTVGGDGMPAVLRGSDVYLSASRADGTSLSLLEAMSAGLFPVVSRIPANAAWLKHGVGGLLHEVGDPDDLAAGILELTWRPALAASAPAAQSGHGRRAGRPRDRISRRLENVYEALLARAPVLAGE